MNKRFINILLSCACLLAFAGCDLKSKAQHHCGGNHRGISCAKTPKKVYGKIYHGGDGRYYTRSHDDGDFWFWMYVMDSGTDSSSGSSRAPNFSGGTWTQVSPPTTPLAATTQVVSQQGGRPTEEVEEESPITDEETIDIETTEADMATMDDAADEGAGDSDSASEGDSAGDSGDSGGGDAGGGDGGGGDGGGGGE